MENNTAPAPAPVVTGEAAPKKTMDPRLRMLCDKATPQDYHVRNVASGEQLNRRFGDNRVRAQKQVDMLNAAIADETEDGRWSVCLSVGMHAPGWVEAAVYDAYEAQG